jgi:hypothetical protein
MRLRFESRGCQRVIYTLLYPGGGPRTPPEAPLLPTPPCLGAREAHLLPLTLAYVGGEGASVHSPGTGRQAPSGSGRVGRPYAQGVGIHTRHDGKKLILNWWSWLVGRADKGRVGS